MARNRESRPCGALAGLALLGLALLGPALVGMGTTMPARAEDEYRLGALFPLSGPTAIFGDIFRSGADLAIEHIRADNQLGRPLVIQYEDGEGQLQPTIIAMNKLAREARLPYILVGVASLSKAVAPIAEREKAIAVNGSAAAPEFAHLSAYFWNLLPLADAETHVLLPFAKAQRGVGRIAVVHVADPNGSAIEQALQDAAGTDQQLVGSFPIEPFDTKFAGLAEKLRAVKPDAVYIAVPGEQRLALIEQLRADGVTQPFLGSSSFADPDLIRAPAAEGTLFTSQKLDWQAQDAVTARFVHDIEARTHREPSIYAANYYNAVLIYAAILKRLEARHATPTGDAVRAELQQLNSIDGVGGKIAIRSDGTVQLPIQVNLITKGAVQAMN